MLKNNILEVKQRIRNACEKSGRDESEITLVAVCKTVDEAIINESISHGIGNIAENRPQEIKRKYDNISTDVKWHMIGQLQTNKVRMIIDLVDMIHSVDSIKLAQEIDKRAGMIGKTMEVLIQVNIAGEVQKSGVEPAQLDEMISFIANCPNLKLKGLMAMMPLVDNPEDVRIYFKQMKEIFDELKSRSIENVDISELSMGMSHDFDVAIEEGATIIRVGSAIYR